jgi:hypothetical protein
VRDVERRADGVVHDELGNVELRAEIVEGNAVVRPSYDRRRVLAE